MLKKCSCTPHPAIPSHGLTPTFGHTTAEPPKLLSKGRRRSCDVPGWSLTMQPCRRGERGAQGLMRSCPASFYQEIIFIFLQKCVLIGIVRETIPSACLWAVECKQWETQGKGMSSLTSPSVQGHVPLQGAQSLLVGKCSLFFCFSLPGRAASTQSPRPFYWVVQPVNILRSTIALQAVGLNPSKDNSGAVMKHCLQTEWSSLKGCSSVQHSRS